MPSIDTLPPLHTDVLKLRAPHLFDHKPRSRSSYAPLRSSPLASPHDEPTEDCSGELTCVNFEVSATRSTMNLKEEYEEAFDSDDDEDVDEFICSNANYSRVSSSERSKSSSSTEALHVVIRILQDSLSEANSAKEWADAALGKATTENMKLLNDLELMERERVDMAEKFERMITILNRRTAEIQLLQQTLALYEGSRIL